MEFCFEQTFHFIIIKSQICFSSLRRKHLYVNYFTNYKNWERCNFLFRYIEVLNIWCVYIKHSQWLLLLLLFSLVLRAASESRVEKILSSDPWIYAIFYFFIRRKCSSARRMPLIEKVIVIWSNAWRIRPMKYEVLYQRLQVCRDYFRVMESRGKIAVFVVLWPFVFKWSIQTY